jgi:hypothetical protein
MKTAWRAEHQRHETVIQPRGKPHVGQRRPSNSTPQAKHDRHPRHGPSRWMQLIASGPSSVTSPQNGQTAEGCRRAHVVHTVQLEVSARRGAVSDWKLPGRSCPSGTPAARMRLRSSRSSPTRRCSRRRIPRATRHPSVSVNPRHTPRRARRSESGIASAGAMPIKHPAHESIVKPARAQLPLATLSPLGGEVDDGGAAHRHRLGRVIDQFRECGESDPGGAGVAGRERACGAIGECSHQPCAMIAGRARWDGRSRCKSLRFRLEHRETP